MRVTCSHRQNKAGVVSIETSQALHTACGCRILELQEPPISLLPNVLYEVGSQAPSLSKDFHHLAVTKTEVRH